jgi:replication factor C small subunit
LSLFNRQYDNNIWALKYRPKTVEELCLPTHIIEQANTIIESGNLPNMLFSGKAGMGKTSLAFVLADILGYSTYYINFSENTGIDTIRTKIKSFVMGLTRDGNKKIVIGDEFERLSVQGQDSLKVMIEDYSSGASFIFISNKKSKIIDPIQSRLQYIDFVFKQKDIKQIKKQFAYRLVDILNKEGIEHHPQPIKKLIKKYFPDMRKIITEMQGLAQQYGKLDRDLEIDNSKFESDNIEEYFRLIKNKDYMGVRKWIENSVFDVNDFYQKIYEVLPDFVDLNVSPEAILYLGDRSKEAEAVINKEINISTFSVELMGCKIK